MNQLHTIRSVISFILFRAKKIHCTVDTKDIRIEIWQYPGQWMEEPDLKNLVQDIRTTALLGHGKKDIPEYGVLKGDRDDLKNRVITIGYEKKTGKPVCFAAQIILDIPMELGTTQVLHLGLVYVAKGFQQKSVLALLYFLPTLLILLKRRFRPIWISNVSQVPSVIGVVSYYYRNVFPDPIQNSKQTTMHKLLGEGIMKHHRKAFGTGEEAQYDAEKQIIYNSYTGGSDKLKKSFDDCSKYRDEKVNTFCRTHLDYQRGDDFLQIGVISVDIIFNFFLRRITKSFKKYWHSTTSLYSFLIPNWSFKKQIK